MPHTIDCPARDCAVENPFVDEDMMGNVKDPCAYWGFTEEQVQELVKANGLVDPRNA